MTRNTGFVPAGFLVRRLAVPAFVFSVLICGSSIISSHAAEAGELETDITLQLTRSCPEATEGMTAVLSIREHEARPGSGIYRPARPLDGIRLGLYDNRNGACPDKFCSSRSPEFFACVEANCTPDLRATTDAAGTAALEFTPQDSVLVIDSEPLDHPGFIIPEPPCGAVVHRSILIPARGAGNRPAANGNVPGCLAEGLTVPATEILKRTPAAPPQPDVRVLYFVPSDLVPDPAQEGRILQASKDVHRWYFDHTDFARTIVWSGAVERVIGFNPLSYYSTDFWGRVLTELSNRSYPIWQPQKVFVIWVKGAGGWAGGAQGGSYAGSALLGGEIFIEDGCVPTTPSLWPCTPAGAMAHELGHALGLPHPDAAGTWFGVFLNSHSLMGTHWNFPERYPRNYVPDSPWGLLNYERDVERYNPLVSALDSPYPPLAGDPMQKPDLPDPPLVLNIALVSPVQSRLTWNADGANNYYAYWSSARDFSNYAPVSGSPTTGTTLDHLDAGEPVIFFKVFEIAVRQ